MNLHAGKKFNKNFSEDTGLYIDWAQLKKLPQIDNPTPEEVDKYHTMYIDTMKKLFDTHKGQYAATGNNAQLEIF